MYQGLRSPCALTYMFGQSQLLLGTAVEFAYCAAAGRPGQGAPSFHRGPQVSEPPECPPGAARRGARACVGAATEAAEPPVVQYVLANAGARYAMLGTPVKLTAAGLGVPYTSSAHCEERRERLSARAHERHARGNETGCGCGRTNVKYDVPGNGCAGCCT